MCDKKEKPDVKKAVGNLAKPMPLTRKLTLLLKNNARKVRHLKTCCGHPGEPGC